MATLYLSAALFGLAGGAGDPQFFFAVLWGLTFTGYLFCSGRWPILTTASSPACARAPRLPPAWRRRLPAAPRPARRPKPGDRLLKPLALALAAASLFEGGRSTLFLWSSAGRRRHRRVQARPRISRGSIFTPVVEWVRPDGKTRRVSPRINIANSPMKVAASAWRCVTIPRPDVARLDAFSDHWFHALMFGCLSLFLFLAHRFAGSPTAAPPA